MTSTIDRPVATVARAITVLNVLADAGGDLGTNEIARRAGMNVSSASRLLATLATGDLVARVSDTGRYRLGLRLIQLGNAALSRVDVRDIARPQLVELTDVTGETATLSIASEHVMMTVDFVQSPSSVRSVAQIGRPSAPHATATGKVFLAYGGGSGAGGGAGGGAEDPLPAYTPRTITDHATLQREIERVREDGWAQATGERENDLHGIAAPVLDGGNRLLAVLGLQGPSSRFTEDAMRAAVPQLLECAARVHAQH